MICEEIKKLSDENSEFLKMLGDTKKLVNKNSDDYTQQIKTLQDRLAMNGKKINTLLDKLSETDEITSGYVNNKIKELHQDNENIKIKIEELDALNKKALLSDTEFDFVKDMMLSFAESFDRMSVEQKRRALRTFIKRIIWDGKNVRVCFFGSKEDEDAEMDLPSDILPPLHDGSKEPQQRGRLFVPKFLKISRAFSGVLSNGTILNFIPGQYCFICGHSFRINCAGVIRELPIRMIFSSPCMALCARVMESFAYCIIYFASP